MKKTRNICMLLIIITLFSLIISPTYALASFKPDNFKPSQVTQSDLDNVANIVNPIIGTIKVIGIAVAVITVIILGFKYMTGSMQERAEYKKGMIPYLIGAVLVVAITQLLGLISSIVLKIT